MALRLFAARHGPTLAAGLCVGQHDVPTTLDAEACAQAIRAQLSGTPAAIHSSPLSRCAGPAAALAGAFRVPHRVDPRLHELHFGAWQGRSWASIERDHPAAFSRYMERWLAEPPPGGERPADLLERVVAWYEGLAEGEHLLVAHAGVVRALRVHTLGQSWQQAMQADVPYLQVQLLAQRP